MQEKIFAFKVDSEGYINDTVAVDKGYELEDEVVSPIPPHVIYKARWTGTEWVEGKSQEEIDAEESLNSLIPTVDEVEHAENEMQILNILMEVGLI